MQATVQSFSTMLRRALGDRLRPGTENFADMLAPDAIMEFPYAPEGFPGRLDGRAAVQAHLANLGSIIAFDRIDDASVHACAGFDLVVLEFTGRGHGVSTRTPYEQRYISVIRLKDGEIVHYRDYWNPMPLLGVVRAETCAGAEQ